jgi:hypothetical protein
VFPAVTYWRLELFYMAIHILICIEVDCSGKRLMQWSVGKFEDIETHFCIKIVF